MHDCLSTGRLWTWITAVLWRYVLLIHLAYLHGARTGLDLEYVTGLELAVNQRRTSRRHVMHGTSMLHLPSDIASADFKGQPPIVVNSIISSFICRTLGTTNRMGL